MCLLLPLFLFAVSGLLCLQRFHPSLWSTFWLCSSGVLSNWVFNSLCDFLSLLMSVYCLLWSGFACSIVLWLTRICPCSASLSATGTLSHLLLLLLMLITLPAPVFFSPCVSPIPQILVYSSLCLLATYVCVSSSLLELSIFSHHFLCFCCFLIFICFSRSILAPEGLCWCWGRVCVVGEELRKRKRGVNIFSELERIIYYCNKPLSLSLFFFLQLRNSYLLRIMAVNGKSENSKLHWAFCFSTCASEG